MRLSTLIQAHFNLPAAADREIKAIALDSRKVVADSLFFAVKGTAIDGTQFIQDAISRGAVAVVVDAQADESLTFIADVPVIPIPKLRECIGPLAALFYDNPGQKLRIIGVTGTNGKTSCTHFIAQALGKPCGVIGTLGSGIYGCLEESQLTTPDAVTLQQWLHDFVKSQISTLAMEVSSHSIDQGRVNGIPFEIGIFTNLTQDHLDYHGNMAAYAAVKLRLFSHLPTQHKVINSDDPYGQAWINQLAPLGNVYAYSCHPPQIGLAKEAKWIYADQVQFTAQGSRSYVHTPWGEGWLQLNLLGEFNLSNALAVLTALCLYGIPFEETLARLSQVQPVAGRMQTITAQGQSLVVVDYSHTPDALEKALQILRPQTKGKLICVFGCGGNRDAGKRPLMARIAEQYADEVILTNDNPRHEQPEAIVEDIKRGFRHPERILVELDRAKAIKHGILLATENDCILIAGRGGERYQYIGDKKIHFDDVEVANKHMMEKINVTVVK